METILADFGPWILVALIWNMFWKGLALWHASQRDQGIWFIALLIVNSFGILEIIYLFLFAKVRIDSLFSKTRKVEGEEVGPSL